MSELDGTVYVYIRGGLVQDVEISKAFDARVNVEVLDFDTESTEDEYVCHCTKAVEESEPHIHYFHEFPEPDETDLSKVFEELMVIANRPHEECDVNSDVECHADGYGDGNVKEHIQLRGWAESIKAFRGAGTQTPRSLAE